MINKQKLSDINRIFLSKNFDSVEFVNFIVKIKHK
jgi:hypothetical protein